MNRTFTWLEHEGKVLITTHIQDDDNELNHKIKISPEKFRETYKDVKESLKIKQMDRKQMLKTLEGIPPSDYNLEPRLEKLKEDIEKVFKFMEAEKKKKEWTGLKENLEVIEKMIKEHEDDLKLMDQIINEVK